MKITRKMLAAATDKAVELGILPSHAQTEDFASNDELMFELPGSCFEAG